MISGPTSSEARGPRKINIVLNWTEELKQRIHVKQQSGLNLQIAVGFTVEISTFHKRSVLLLP
jgi:hypothetical protein